MFLAGRQLRTTVLLGAGATKGAYSGIGRRKIRPPLNRDFFSVADRFVKTPDGAPYAASLRRLQDFIKKEIRLSPEDITMEGVFNILFISKDLPAIFRRGGPYRRAGFRREITDFFAVLVGLLRFVQENPRHPGRLDHHFALARSLGDGDCIVSLNYDTLIDNALLLSGWDPATGYGFPAATKLVYRGMIKPPRARRDILLLKPHGSLNWFARGSLEAYEEVLTKRSPSRIVIAQVPPAYTPAGQQMVRFFVPPLYSKFFGNSFWRILWETAFEALTTSEQLVVIGCSMIEADFHLRSILARALAKRRDKFRRIVIVDSSTQVRDRLKTFLRGRGEHGFDMEPSFTEFVNGWL